MRVTPTKDTAVRLESPFLDEEIHRAAAEPARPVPSEGGPAAGVGETREAELDEDTNEADVDAFEFDTTKPGSRGTVTVVLDEPVDADDAFRLESHDGAYRKTLRAADAQRLVAGERVLRFEGVSTTRRYLLRHLRSKRSTRPVFLALPFKDLTEAGHGPQTARHTYVTLPSQVPGQLPDKHGMDRPVDPDLIAQAPALVDLEVEDPRV